MKLRRVDSEMLLAARYDEKSRVLQVVFRVGGTYRYKNAPSDKYDLTRQVIGCAYKVHNVLGFGFLEKVYENAFKFELNKIGIDVQQQGKLPV